MALTPLPFTGALAATAQQMPRAESTGSNKNSQVPIKDAAKSNVTSISDTIETAKESSLLYQLINPRSA